MNDSAEIRRSHIFVVRVWSEPLGDGKEEWRGQVRSPAGDARYFRDWDTLVSHIRDALRVKPEPPDAIPPKPLS